MSIVQKISILRQNQKSLNDLYYILIIYYKQILFRNALSKDSKQQLYTYYG